MNSTVRLQNIYGNKQAPSRDIANHFAVVEHLRYICNGGYYDSNERWSDMHVHLCTCITAALSQVHQRPSRPLQLRPGSEFFEFGTEQGFESQ